GTRRDLFRASLRLSRISCRATDEPLAASWFPSRHATAALLSRVILRHDISATAQAQFQAARFCRRQEAPIPARATAMAPKQQTRHGRGRISQSRRKGFRGKFFRPRLASGLRPRPTAVRAFWLFVQGADADCHAVTKVIENPPFEWQPSPWPTIERLIGDAYQRDYQKKYRQRKRE